MCTGASDMREGPSGWSKRVCDVSVVNDVRDEGEESVMSEEWGERQGDRDREVHKWLRERQRRARNSDCRRGREGRRDDG